MLTQDGSTPLHAAAERGRAEGCRVKGARGSELRSGAMVGVGIGIRGIPGRN